MTGCRRLFGDDGFRLIRVDRCGIGLLAVAGAAWLGGPTLAQSVGGTAVQHQTITVEWDGPAVGEGIGTTNPFLNHRLDVEFSNGQTSYTVPGYYAIDNATGQDIWRAHFTAPTAGQWDFTPNYYIGGNVAVTDINALGVPNATEINGQTGSVNIAAADPNAAGFLSKGTLQYTGGHYLQFANGDYYLKGGADSPENFLGYEGFDNTTKNSVPPARGILHTYSTHVADWQAGDPDWDDDDADAIANDGRGIIGALNYLHNLGDTAYTGPAKVNSIYFLPMNIGGDGQDTHPFASTTLDLAGNSSNDNLRYDLSKLDQWETVFTHAQKKGIMLHFVLNEAEAPNKQELDNASLGDERKLFYREMIARFGHHQAIVWNVSEEYNLGNGFGANDPAEAATVETFADWIKSIDPYGHPVTVHNAGNPNPGGGPTAGSWQYFIGDVSWDATSLQLFNNFQTLGDAVEAFRTATANAGRPIPIMIDEPESVEDVSFDQVRKEMMWDILLSGGNVEWYTRSQDQSLDNFRLLEQVYEETFYARRLVEMTPFWEMNPADNLLSGEDGFAGDSDPGEVFAKTNDTYALYLPGSDATDTGVLDLGGASGKFVFRWYDPTTGQFADSPLGIVAGGGFDLPDTPGTNGGGDSDWAALLTRLDAFGFTQADLLAVLQNYGALVSTGDFSLGDVTVDGVVNDADLDLVLRQWAGDSPPNINIPEPGSAVAVCVAGLAGLRRRRHRI